MRCSFRLLFWVLEGATPELFCSEGAVLRVRAHEREQRRMNVFASLRL